MLATSTGNNTQSEAKELKGDLTLPVRGKIYSFNKQTSLDQKNVKFDEKEILKYFAGEISALGYAYTNEAPQIQRHKSFDKDEKDKASGITILQPVKAVKGTGKGVLQLKVYNRGTHIELHRAVLNVVENTPKSDTKQSDTKQNAAWDIRLLNNAADFNTAALHEHYICYLDNSSPDNQKTDSRIADYFGANDTKKATELLNLRKQNRLRLLFDQVMHDQKMEFKALDFSTQMQPLLNEQTTAREKLQIFAIDFFEFCWNGLQTILKDKLLEKEFSARFTGMSEQERGERVRGLMRDYTQTVSNALLLHSDPRISLMGFLIFMVVSVPQINENELSLLEKGNFSEIIAPLFNDNDNDAIANKENFYTRLEAQLSHLLSYLLVGQLSQQQMRELAELYLDDEEYKKRFIAKLQHAFNSELPTERDYVINDKTLQDNIARKYITLAQFVLANGYEKDNALLKNDIQSFIKSLPIKSLDEKNSNSTEEQLTLLRRNQLVLIKSEEEAGKQLRKEDSHYLTSVITTGLPCLTLAMTTQTYCKKYYTSLSESEQKEFNTAVVGRAEYLSAITPAYNIKRDGKFTGIPANDHAAIKTLEKHEDNAAIQIALENKESGFKYTGDFTKDFETIKLILKLNPSNKKDLLIQYYKDHYHHLLRNDKRTLNQYFFDLNKTDENTFTIFRDELTTIASKHKENSLSYQRKMWEKFKKLAWWEKGAFIVGTVIPFTTLYTFNKVDKNVTIDYYDSDNLDNLLYDTEADKQLQANSAKQTSDAPKATSQTTSLHPKLKAAYQRLVPETKGTKKPEPKTTDGATSTIAVDSKLDEKSNFRKMLLTLGLTERDLDKPKSTTPTITVVTTTNKQLTTTDSDEKNILTTYSKTTERLGGIVGVNTFAANNHRDRSESGSDTDTPPSTMVNTSTDSSDHSHHNSPANSAPVTPVNGPANDNGAQVATMDLHAQHDATTSTNPVVTTLAPPHAHL